MNDVMADFEKASVCWCNPGSVRPSRNRRLLVSLLPGGNKALEQAVPQITSSEPRRHHAGFKVILFMDDLWAFRYSS